MDIETSRIENPERHSSICGQIIFNKAAKIIHWRCVSFQQMALGEMDTTCKIMKLDLALHHGRKSKIDKKLNLKA